MPESVSVPAPVFVRASVPAELVIEPEKLPPETVSVGVPATVLAIAPEPASDPMVADWALRLSVPAGPIVRPPVVAPSVPPASSRSVPAVIVVPPV